MREFKPEIYRSFAEFFDREFRPGARTFVAAANEMAAFAEARYFGWNRLEADQQFPVKGHSLGAEQILGNKSRAAPFFRPRIARTFVADGLPPRALSYGRSSLCAQQSR